MLANNPTTIAMHITLIVNPKSGRAHAKPAAETLTRELVARKHRVSQLEMGADPRILESTITCAQRVVVLGGDGTVHHLLPILARAQTPMYHMGFGTANLISKSFSMSTDPIKVANDLEAEHEPYAIDLPACNGHPFLIMVSLGIDASVIHRFEESRTHKAGYRAYIQPVLRELISPRPARFTLESEQPSHNPKPTTGVLVIANLPAYGGHFDPCPNADPSDGVLDAITIPCTTTVGAAINYALLRIRRSSSRMHRFKSNQFTITASKTNAYVQLDGEKASNLPGTHDGILISGDQLRCTMTQEKIQIHMPRPRS